MNPHTRTDNNHIFQPSGSSPRYREEASRSWWMDTPREAFTEAAEREQRRMARSRGAVMAKGITVGWSVPKSRRSL